MAASFEMAVVDALVRQTLRACERENLHSVLVAGGVACNLRLRQELEQRAQEQGIRVSFPRPELCTDNAVMIAGLGYELLGAGRLASLDIDALPR